MASSIQSCHGGKIQKRRSCTKGLLGSFSFRSATLPRLLRPGSLPVGLNSDSPTSSPAHLKWGRTERGGHYQMQAPEQWFFHHVEDFQRGPHLAASLSWGALDWAAAWLPIHTVCRSIAQDQSNSHSTFSWLLPFSEPGFEQNLNKSLNFRGETQKTLPGFSNPCLK